MSDHASPKPAVFIDRDGTLVEEVNYLARVEDLRLFASTPKAVSDLKAAGYHVVVVTNQSGIGRGIYGVEDMESVHHAMQEQLDGQIDGFFYCPHLPCDGCDCRKPLTGMIRQAAEALDIDLENSWMIGDKKIDVETGTNAGIRRAMVLTGYGREHLAQLAHQPEIIAEDIGAAVDALIKMSPDQARPKSSSSLSISSSPK